VTTKPISGRVFQRASNDESIFTRTPRRAWRERPGRFAFEQLSPAFDKSIVSPNHDQVVNIATVDRSIEGDDESLS
jgi:hypothetical protein